MINIERFGNTTAATIPLALADALRDGRLRPGHLVMLTSVGAGFTVGAVLLRWADTTPVSAAAAPAPHADPVHSS